MYALFLDLRKAYDLVHPKALWVVLRHMGVPGIIVSLLEDWSTKRITTMTRDGVASAPWHMSMGVGQGDVLSPLLFSFFIESLGRYVSSRPGINGVSIGAPNDPAGSITVKELKYADDVANPATTPSELQVVLNATVEWCDAWGMQIGLGSKKTEAVAFIPPRLRASHPLLPQLSVKGVVVPWATEYRYLGYLARDDLCDDGSLTAMTEKLAGQWQRYFSTRALSRSTPLHLRYRFSRPRSLVRQTSCLPSPTHHRAQPAASTSYLLTPLGKLCVSAIIVATVPVTRWCGASHGCLVALLSWPVSAHALLSECARRHLQRRTSPLVSFVRSLRRLQLTTSRWLTEQRVSHTAFWSLSVRVPTQARHRRPCSLRRPSKTARRLPPLSAAALACSHGRLRLALLC